MPTEPRPRRSESEFLALVHQKAGAIRRRRLMTATAIGTAACLVVAGASVGLAGGGSGRKRVVHAAGQPGETTSTSEEGTTSTTSGAVVTPVEAATTTTTAPLQTHWRTVVGGDTIDVTLTPGRPAAGELVTATIKEHQDHGAPDGPQIDWGDGTNAAEGTLYCDVRGIQADGNTVPPGPPPPPTDFTVTRRHTYRISGTYTVKLSIATDCVGHTVESSGKIDVAAGPRRSNGPEPPTIDVSGYWDGNPDPMVKHVLVEGLDPDGFVSRVTLDWGDGSAVDVNRRTGCIDDGRAWPRNGNPQSSSTDFSHTYASPGQYTLHATVTSSGCDGADPQTVEASAPEPVVESTTTTQPPG